MVWHHIRSLRLWKKIYVWIYILTVCLLLFFCVVRFLTDRESMRLYGAQNFTEGVAEERILYEGISLKAGVYEVVQRYRTDRDYSGLCSVRDESLSPHVLCTNGEHLYQGLQQTGYTFWLYRPAGHLQFTVSYGGEGLLETGDLLIINTGKLWSMLFVVVLCLGIAGLIFAVFVCYDRQYGILAQRKYSIIFLFFITFLVSLPQLHTYLLGGADLTYHLQRIEGVKDGLLGGQFPVRIEPEWLYGHGYANGIFYCNSLLYLPALLRLAGFDVTVSYQLFCICLNFMTVFISWYCFTGIFEDERIGVMCSALYSLSIFRIRRFFMVAAVGEGSAIAFLPLVFYGMYRILTQDPKDRSYRTAWLPVAFGYAGLIQTHVLTCEMTAFVTLLVCIVCIRRIFRPAVFSALAKGALGAVGLSLWYLVPFLDYYLTQDMHIRHVSGRTIQERGMYFRQLFVNFWDAEVTEELIQKGLVYLEPQSPGWLCLAALAVFFLLWLCGRLRGGRGSVSDCAKRQAAKFSALAAVLLLFLSLRVFPWDRIQQLSALLDTLVSSLQFPYRFMGWAMVFLVTVFGFVLWQYRDKRGVYLIGGLFTALSIFTTSVYMINHIIAEENHISLYNEEGMGFGYISGAEYLVEGTDDLLLTFAGPTAGENVSITDYGKKYLHVMLSCVNESVRESYVELPLLLYKGYQARTSSGERLEIVHGDNHKLRVLLPAGFEDTLEVDFVSPGYWRISEIITLLSIGLILRAAAKYHRQKT